MHRFFSKAIVMIVALAVLLTTVVVTEAATYEWKTWKVKETHSTTGEEVVHRWRTSNVQGAVYGIYVGPPDSHAVTISEFNGRPLVRWTADYRDRSARPPFPLKKVIRFYY